MTNIKPNQICSVCKRQYIRMGIEKKIDLNHQEYGNTGYSELGTEIDIKEFKDDIHLECRIRCAKYFLVGLRSMWFSENQFIVSNDNKAAFDAIQRIEKMHFEEIRSNNGIYLYGSSGTGKTLLLACLCKNFINQGRSTSNISWRNTPSILTQIKASFGKKSTYEETAQEMILKKLKTSFLFLDDLGTESATDWAKEIFYEVVNYRYEERLPLFVTSNLSPKELSDKFGDKFVSRIIEMCTPIKVTGDDWRLKKRDGHEQVINSIIPAFSYEMAWWNNDLKLFNLARNK